MASRLLLKTVKARWSTHLIRRRFFLDTLKQFSLALKRYFWDEKSRSIDIIMEAICEDKE
jgi:hypothetical protein